MSRRGRLEWGERRSHPRRLIEIALEGQRIGFRVVGKPVHAEPAAALPPLVVGDAIGEISGSDIKILAVDAPEEVVAGVAAVAAGADPFVLVAAARAHQSTLRVLGALADDVDHAVDGIGAPEGSARAADDLDPLHVLQHHVLLVPEHAGTDLVVDAAAVDQHQELVGVDAVEAANADGPGVGADAGHVHAWRHSQGFGNVGRAATADHILRDYENCRGRPPDRALFLHHRRHFHVHRRDLDVGLGKLIEVHVEQGICGVTATVARSGRVGRRSSGRVGSAGGSGKHERDAQEHRGRESTSCARLPSTVHSVLHVLDRRCERRAAAAETGTLFLNFNTAM